MIAASPSEDLTREDYAAVEQLLRRIDAEHSRRASLETLANWKLGFKLFRELELNFERMPDRSAHEAAHRALLTGFLALSEALQLKITALSDDDLRKIELSKESFTGCVKYMRQKYNQWFAPVDSSVVRLFETRMAEQ